MVYGTTITNNIFITTLNISTGINNISKCWRKAFESWRGSTWLVIRNTNQDGIEINISIVLLQVLIITSNVGARPLSPEGVQRGWSFATPTNTALWITFHRFTTGITSASKTSRHLNHNGGNVNIWTIATRINFNPLDYASTARYYLT